VAPSAAVPLELSATLRAAGYTPAALQRELGISVPDDIGLLNHAPALERLARDGSAAATLIRLFFLETAEPERRLARVFGRRGCTDLVATGVLRRRGPTLQARVRIDAVGGQYLAADRRFQGADRAALGLPRGDAVYPPSSDSLMLRDAVIAPDVRRVLDLCTGSGIQALQLAGSAGGVVAVDVNPRAAAVADFNARLNGVDNVDVRVGDLYAPVRDERFDVIIANPPFVASPYANAPSYHRGGPRGDRVLGRILGGLARHLGDGGRAFAITHLAARGGEDVQSAASKWFRDFPGRALVLIVETGTPVDLAAAQALFALERGLKAYAAEVRGWVEYLRRHRIERVSALLIVAERGEKRGVEVVDAQPRVLPIPLAPQPVERIKSWLG
jgi:carbamoyltransferase